ncbi:MAG TPA: hypothetical protein VGQ15_15560 [Gaiellaceae bacterium]|nr:hypothetical protein [Gaiellaceae bacterium]
MAALSTPTTAAAQQPGPRLNDRQALAIFIADPKVKSWLERYPPNPTTESTFEQDTRRWRIKIWSGEAGQIADGFVDDGTGAVLEAWTGPQVAWTMARGSPGAFGGKTINRPVVWFAFVGVFLLGLIDWRRPLTLRTLDLIALVSFSASLWFFNEGDVFTSMPLAYPPLVYLIARLAWIGAQGRPPRGRAVWPIWLLAGAAVFLAGFRIALNHSDSNVIDVGYSGVVGAQRIATGQMPYGHMPVSRGTPCGPADALGNVYDYVQTNARCERADERGDTYGPVAYLAYLPGYWLFGWGGKWDTLPAAHFTAVLFDLLTLAGLVLVGLRFGGLPFAATLAFAWTAYPFTLYAMNSNTNDSIMPAFLVWGFWLVSRPGARGALAALSGWTKFASLIAAPLWATYPDRRPKARFLVGFLAASLLVFGFLLLEPNPLEAARTFGDRSIVWQIGRESPFSIWDWRQYHAAGIPDLHLGQRSLQILLVLGAIAAAFFPRRKSPLQLAALTGALLAGFQLVQTHWFYLYLPWFFPFAAIVFLGGDRAR